MSGRFEGMSDAEWEFFKNIFSEKTRKGRGMPATHPRKVLNLPLTGMQLSACSAPANEDERKHVDKLIETVSVKTGKAGRPGKNVRRLAADKGYDAR